MTPSAPVLLAALVAVAALVLALSCGVRDRRRTAEKLRRLEAETARLTDEAAALARAKREVERLAFIDVLTGLPNRNLFHNRLAHALAVADRNGRHVALMLVDLNRFKDVNDALGHAAGDAALGEAGRRLRAVLRQADTVARVGGDEFAVILETGAGTAGPRCAAERIVAAFAEPVALDGTAFELGVAIGVAVYPDDAEDPEALLRRADAAMYRAKARGASAAVLCGPDTPNAGPAADFRPVATGG